MQAIVVYPKEVFHEEHNRVMPIDVPDTGMFPDSQLNSVFRMMNAVDGSAIEKYLRQYCCRSMSVGDCVKLDGKWFRCAMVGWNEIVDVDEIQKLEAMVI